MKSDDETAKLASTEEETRCEDEETTSLEDESDTDCGRAWSVDTEDDEVVRSPTINYLNFQDPEPEWDVDSFDGYECYDSEDRKSFSDDEEYEEFRVFKIQTWKNKILSGLSSPLTDLEEPWTTMTTREYFADIASLCVKKLNEEKGTTVEVVSIVRGNLKVRRWLEAVHHFYGSRVYTWSSSRVFKLRPWILEQNLPFHSLQRAASTIS
ncbi:uncharacterized protein LOC108845593 [Raphanus sativus]|uniref:Uncharacterized protein LOC108845593 n=1 Tax=Raphanus sativus TaxID=3726 RepID=A0A9W3DEY8_RAPSA|nr:uncharacterized protein LOC108845593 [Raphanus sativus]